MSDTTIIHFQQLWAAYRTEPVLMDINWHWQSSQQWAILGGNGAGKSAIAQLIADQLRPQRGSVARGIGIDPERDVLHLSFELQRQLIAHDIRFDDSEQRSDAFDVGTTVAQIVLQKQAPDQRFLDIAKQCHIEHILDQGIRFVSTGESRKTLLARALLMPPKLLILDNPFEGLDRESQQQLRQLINQLLQSSLRILLLIKQTDEIPEHVSHVLHLEQGTIQRQGLRDEVIAVVDGQQSRINIGALPAAVARNYQVDHDTALLDLKGVNISYQQQKILHDINWHFDWGQHCMIAGPNGAGKSTLLSLLSGDNHRAYGQDISLFGKTRGSGESVAQLKQKFGIVSTALQLNHVGRVRVAEVIASGLYDSVGLYQQCTGRDRKIALDWLRLMGLEDIAEQFFNQLSFGQQRLAMLARAMVKSPLILILDEPCIGLDQAHRELIIALVDKIAARGDCHILYVSHSAGEIPQCINQQLLLQPHPEGGYSAAVSHYP